jgi:hypothetical protein
MKEFFKKGLPKMKMKCIYDNSTLQCIFLLSLLCLLPGCAILDWFKEKFGGAKSPNAQVVPQQTNNHQAVMATQAENVLVTMNGKPVITTEILKSEKEELMESNPQLRSIMAFIDAKQLDRNLVEGLTSQAIVDRFIAEHNINTTKEYQQELERAIKSIKQMLNAKFFSQHFDVSVSDSDVRNFYEQNKQSMPNLIISRGGIKTTGVKFEQESVAKDFLTKAQSTGNLPDAATKANMPADHIKDFNVVNEQSIGIDTALRDKIITLKQVPTIELIKIDDNTFWVVHASEKEEPKYQPFEQVQNNLKMILEKEKRTEMFEQEINRLKDKYNVVIREDYFKADEQPTTEVHEEDLPEQEEEGKEEADTLQNVQKKESKQTRYV